MSRVGDGALEDFKARLPLVDIVARHVRLIRRGNRHQGLCPFHQEKSPSFYVFEDQGNYHCFGCGAHGNAIDFIMAIEGLPFAEALRRLSDLTGIPAPLRSPDQAETSAERVNPLLAANEAARGWFQEQLAASAGRIARDYLQRRSVPEALQSRFAIGYAPDGRDAMVRALEARGVAVATQVQAGLAIDPEDGGRPFDRFRHRLMFPITDQRGRLVGFGGRALGDAKAKYLNTPETPLFKKGSLLYGHDLASKPAREKKEIFIVEGYLDVIAMHEAGFANTVAPLGTAIGEDQLKLLWRYGEEPYVCLDGDAAGLAAALRMIRRALPIMAGGQTLRFVVLPAGEDPDSLLHGRGRAAFEDLLASAVPLSQMIWQAEHNAAPVETPEQLAGLRRRLLDYVRLTGDEGCATGSSGISTTSSMPVVAGSAAAGPVVGRAPVAAGMPAGRAGPKVGRAGVGKGEAGRSHRRRGRGGRSSRPRCSRPSVIPSCCCSARFCATRPCSSVTPTISTAWSWTGHRTMPDARF